MYAKYRKIGLYAECHDAKTIKPTDLHVSNEQKKTEQVYYKSEKTGRLECLFPSLEDKTGPIIRNYVFCIQLFVTGMIFEAF